MALTGKKSYKNNTVRLGVGLSCFVVAVQDPTSDDIDYDVISISPLSHLSFSCHNHFRRLEVHSALKSTQVYQLNTSDDQDEVWDEFTSYIRKLYVGKSRRTMHDQTTSSLEESKRESMKSDTNLSTASSTSYLLPFNWHIAMWNETERHRATFICSVLQRSGSSPNLSLPTNVEGPGDIHLHSSNSERNFYDKSICFHNKPKQGAAGLHDKIFPYPRKRSLGAPGKVANVCLDEATRTDKSNEDKDVRSVQDNMSLWKRIKRLFTSCCKCRQKSRR